MGKNYEYEVKIKSDTFDMITANTAFYQFVGERLYNTFDMFMEKDDKDRLVRMIEDKQQDRCFSLHMYDLQKNIVEMVASIEKFYEDNSVLIRLVTVEGMYSDNLEMKKQIEDDNMLLARNASVYYTYETDSRQLTCYKMEPEKHIIMCSDIDRVSDMIKHQVNEELAGKIDMLFADIKNGVRDFEYSLDGKDIPVKVSKDAIFVYGNAVYKNGVHVRTVGAMKSAHMVSSNEVLRRDQLTGLILKEDITNLAKKRIDTLKQPTTIAIIDIDEFKHVNDSYGHKRGDDVLRRCASIINDEVSGYGSAGRIGGDEFFIVLDYMENNEDLRSLLRSIKNSIQSAYTMEEDGFQVTTSIGCASYPKDVDSFDNLFLLADYLLYRAKIKGKNRYITYNVEKHGTVEDILKQGIENIGITSRKGMSKAEIVCKMSDKVFCGEGYTLDNIFNDIVDYFGVERVLLYSVDDDRVVRQCGNKLLPEEKLADVGRYIICETINNLKKNGVLVVNNVKMFDNVDHELYNGMLEHEILSFMHHDITGVDGRKYVVSYQSVAIRITWNMEDMYYYRLIDRVLSNCL